ncbi:hypothetical membrane protein, conserved [Thermococcus onnurineus NA1]|uniref:Hypothetical membrane protein, conserved n=1 Tax=Thermococcus onnurineus (strain NA1) TaxID=523850 RepID=B6YUA2_THEON|nr:hypothetical protein [Thermococcus onnurineus]ACJ17087.1 hypothetical membrane protein, conserved [Thermococcus onnurineus NA1]
MIDHHTLGYLTFALISLTMLSGAFIFLLERKNFWIKVHVVLSVVTYLIIVILIWFVR